MKMAILCFSLIAANAFPESVPQVGFIRDFKATPGPVVKEIKSVNRDSVVTDLIGVMKDQQSQIERLKK